MSLAQGIGVTRYALLSLFCLLALFTSLPTNAQTSAVTNTATTSLEPYRMEVRYLSRKLGEIDLKGPPIITDGWKTNIAEAE